MRLLADAALVGVVWTTILVVLPITPTASRSLLVSLVMAGFVTVITIIALFQLGMYFVRPALPRTDEISRLALSSAIGAASLATLAAFSDRHVGATELLLGTVLVFSLRSIGRAVAQDVLRSRDSSAGTVGVVIVGVGPDARDLCQLVLDQPESQMRLLGVIGNYEVAVRTGIEKIWLGPTENLRELIGLHDAGAAIVTATGFRAQQFRELTTLLFDAGLDVHLSTGILRLNAGRITTRSLVHEPLVVLEQRRISHAARAVKRSVDVTLALAALVVAAPVMLLVALAVKLTSPGPVFFPSPRFGRNAEPFSMWKFRSMVADAEARQSEVADQNDRTGPIFKIQNDPRVTRVGRIIRETSLDELPQLFNVLKGEMSLVGPRPALPAEEAAFEGEHRKRFNVRPGITGLWQVEARSNANFSAYRRLDLHYMENWSLSLDFRIMLATAEQIVVSALMLPLRRMLGSPSVDGVNGGDSGVIVDLRTGLPPRAAEQPSVNSNGVLPDAQPAAADVEPAAAD